MRRDGAGGMSRFLILVAVLFLGTRLGWMTAVDAAPMSDQLWYFQRAVGLLDGQGYSVGGQPTAFWPVGYPAFLAGLFAVTGPSLEAAKAANLVLSAAALVFLFRIARRATRSETAARAALVLAVLSPTLVFYTELLYAELLFMALLLAGLDALLAALDRPGWRRPALAGLCFGLAALVKTQALLLPACVIAAAFVLRRAGLRRAVAVGLVLHAACLAVIAPWTLRNALVLGEPVLVSTNGGFNLFMGNNPWNRWGNYMWPAPAEFTAATEGLNILEPIPDEIALDRRLNQAALSYIRDNPAQALLRVPYKLDQFFRFDRLPLDQAEIGARRNGQDVGALVAAVTPLAELWHWAMVVPAFLFPFLFPWALRPRDAALAAFVPIGYFAAITGVFFGEPRFNLPLLPLYALLAVSLAAGLLRAVPRPGTRFGKRA
ncbi:glycosyltransferase family 39 protein [Skermanella rosea]|uniref:ArnT family glycosyltransferase n=1 Tax=Skermanella rosea TaxID=1817965 RepID=UPI0019321CB3|nr:glycosyltransferase family 39 protein [Skermanella rosea]UEM02743.1 glycosyltransferase family 39 protein [Skermanella rosea]